MSRALRSTANSLLLDELPPTRRKSTRRNTSGRIRSRSMDDNDIESDSSRPVDDIRTNGSTDNVSRTQVLNIEQNTNQEPLDENNESESPPAQNIAVDSSDFDNEAERLRNELETIQKESQEFARRKTDQN